ncbi:PAS domain-containing protein [Ferrovibrio sp.]|uniref:PAS domain-containing protein n=1 Tax=Ferrovibrio sp. TaxID=1917215 RepID=UPI001B7B7D46|nr:PAS domain-containing protein [Ferrovibrio sp.]MBP7063097.1 PAS domain-containing protein [Ferrovibrio sp.]
MPNRNAAFRLLTANEQLAEPRLSRLFEDWQRAALWRGLPGTSFADPLHLRYLLGSLVLIDVVRDGLGRRRFRYRLVGTNIVDRQGKDRTGTWLDRHGESDFAAAALKVCNLVAEQRQPVYAGISRRLLGRYYPVEFLVLPMGGKQVERLIAAQLYPDNAPLCPYGIDASAQIDAEALAATG